MNNTEYDSSPLSSSCNDKSESHEENNNISNDLSNNAMISNHFDHSDDMKSTLTAENVSRSKEKKSLSTIESS